MTDCIFCKIVNKELPADVIYENDDVLVFMSLEQITPGHLLVIPKKHYVNLIETPEDVLKSLMGPLKKCVAAVDTLHEGSTVGQNNHEAGGQVIFHLHFHIIPRNSNDGLTSWANNETTLEERAAIAQTIRDAMDT